MPKPTRIVAADRLGAVEAFMLARVVPAPGRLVTCSDAFADYRQWCVTEDVAPLRESEFLSVFETVARSAGIPVHQRGSNMTFVDTALDDLRGLPRSVERGA